MIGLLPICPYCGQFSVQTTGKVIYPHRDDLADKVMYHCEPCKAWVGCHPNGKPFGRLANSKLRYLKIQAHAALDSYWQNGEFKREDVYHMLSKAIDIPRHACHIGWFDVEQCKRVIDLCNSREILRFNKE